MSKASKRTAAARRAEMEEVRRVESSRERRIRILTITINSVIAVGLVGWGHQISVTSASDVRGGHFLTHYVQGPQTPDPGAARTGGLTS